MAVVSGVYNLLLWGDIDHCEKCDAASAECLLVKEKAVQGNQSREETGLGLSKEDSWCRGLVRGLILLQPSVTT